MQAKDEPKQLKAYFKKNPDLLKKEKKKKRKRKERDQSYCCSAYSALWKDF